MPIPFLLALGLGAGAYGVKKGLDASDMMSEAKKISETAKKEADRLASKRDSVKELTNQSLISLGQTKMEILSSTMNEFVECFSQIKHVDLAESIGIDELRKFNPQSKEFLDLKQATLKAIDFASGGLGGAAAGGLAAAGAYGAVGALASASTGTAIAGLSGAAATNATLAWLGGGTLATGGAGVAGGMAALGGLVAGPAILVGGLYLSSKAEEAYNEALTYAKKAETFCTECENVCTLMNAISERANQIDELLIKLNDRFAQSVGVMKYVVSMEGNDWRCFSKQGKKQVAASAQMAQTLKNIIDTSLLHEDGSLDSSSEEVVQIGCELIGIENPVKKLSHM